MRLDYIKAYLQLSNLKKQPIFINMASLGLLQIANYIIPIIVIPFVVRALGVDAYGKASYAQNIIAYLTIIVNYGFEYSATQEVAIHRNNHNKLVNIFWTVVYSKLILLCVSFIILGILYFAFDKVHNDLPLFLCASIVNFGFALFPTWFFQGIEKMGKMAAFNFAIRVVSGTLTILLITAPEHYRYYLLITSLAYIVVGIIAFIYVIKTYNLKYEKKPEFEKPVVSKGLPIFINNVCASLYTTAGFTILGFYCNDTELGYYSGAYKIIMAFVMLTSMPISLSLFPVISRKFSESKDEGFKIFKKSAVIVASFAILITLFIFFTAEPLTNILLGDKFTPSIKLLKVFSVLPFLIIMASMFTVQGLYGMQLQKFAPLVGLTVGVSCVIITLVLIPHVGYYAAAIGYICSEMLEILISGGLILSRFKK